jgi:hypothetical protein
MHFVRSKGPHAIVALAPALALAPAAPSPASAGQQEGGLVVSAEVVRAHRPDLAASLPVPQPAHVFHEDAGGRHYFFEGDLRAARTYYQAAMPRRGFGSSASTPHARRGTRCSGGGPAPWQWWSCGPSTACHPRE